MSALNQQLWNEWMDLSEERKVSVAHQLFPYLVGVMSCLPESPGAASASMDRFEKRWAEVQGKAAALPVPDVTDGTVNSIALKGGIAA